MLESLQEYGLSKSEAEVYLSALVHGKVSSYDLARYTGIKRSSTYDVVASLQKLGLISEATQEGKKVFSAAPPQVLMQILKEKQRMTEGLVGDLNKIANQSPSETHSEVFEGLIAVKRAAFDMLRAEKIDMYGASHVAEEVFGSYTANFAQRRKESRIELRAVIAENPPMHMLDEGVKEITTLRKNMLFQNHKTAYFMYDGKVLIITLGQPVSAVKIVNEYFFESQQSIFSHLWNVSKI